MSNSTVVAASSSSSGGIGFAGLLTVLFIAFKLTHVVDWAWVWVLCPMWISAGLVALVICVAIAAVIFSRN